MGTDSKIEWTDDTVNAWWGCVEVSPACAHCYAKAWAKRMGRDLWGLQADRWIRVDKAIHELEAIAAKGDREGRLRRVFLQSMSDLFEERHDLREPRARLFEALHKLGRRITPLLLTKRAEFMVEEVKRLGWPDAAWAGVTVEDQLRADERIPWLLRVPAAVRFLSVEPMLSGIDLTGPLGLFAAEEPQGSLIDWVIIGSESDGPRPGARETRHEWIESLVEQCDAASVPVFVKQAAIGNKLCSLPMVNGRVRADFPAVTP